MRKIFLGFGGRPNSFLGKRVKISDAFELLNLEDFKRVEIYRLLRNEVYIEPHLLSKSNRELFPFSFQSERKMCWGMLIREDLLGTLEAAKIIATINLYADIFLVPLYKVNNLGGKDIRSWPKGGLSKSDYWGQNSSRIFLGRGFERYCAKLKSQVDYHYYDLYKIEAWLREQDEERKRNTFRIYLACSLFKELKTFQSGKDIVLCLKEASEIATIIECLLVNRKEKDKKKTFTARGTLLLSFRKKGIASEFKELYKKRSEYVHGEYYRTLASASNLDSASGMPFPMPDFAFFQQATEHLRDILSVYLYLNSLIQNGRFGNIKSVQSLIKKAFICPTTRSKLKRYAREILKDRTY